MTEISLFPKGPSFFPNLQPDWTVEGDHWGIEGKRVPRRSSPQTCLRRGYSGGFIHYTWHCVRCDNDGLQRFLGGIRSICAETTACRLNRGTSRPQYGQRGSPYGIRTASEERRRRAKARPGKFYGVTAPEWSERKCEQNDKVSKMMLLLPITIHSGLEKKSKKSITEFRAKQTTNATTQPSPHPPGPPSGFLGHLDRGVIYTGVISEGVIMIK